jgi:hypothetical protein
MKYLLAVAFITLAAATWPGPLPLPWKGPEFRHRCEVWHWNGAKPIDNDDWAMEDQACGHFWRYEHHCDVNPDQKACD